MKPHLALFLFLILIFPSCSTTSKPAEQISETNALTIDSTATEPGDTEAAIKEAEKRVNEKDKREVN